MDQVALNKPASLESPSRITEAGLVHLLTISALYVFFAADLANKVFVYLGLGFTRVSVFFRSFYEFFFLIVILLFLNAARRNFLLVLVGLFGLFMVGQILFAMNVEHQVHFGDNTLFFNKYFFAFIIFYSIYKLREHPGKFAHAIKVMEMLFVINALATLAGLALGLSVFRTYVLQPYRFGYSGILWVQNEATIMCFLGIAYFYYKHFVLGERSKKFYIILLAALFLGTKAIYLFMAMLLVFHFMTNSKLSAKIAVFVIAILTYFFIDWFLKSDLSKEILAYFVSKFEGYGIWYVLFSGRTSYLASMNTEILQYWTPLNYLVGGEDPTHFMIEMDFFDLFLFLGLIGFVIYFMLLFATLFRLNYKKPFNLFFVFSYMLLAFVAGHFFSSVINALYLCLICMYFQSTGKSTTVLNEKNTAGQ